MSVEGARDLLIQHETEAAEVREKLAEARAVFEKTIKEISQNEVKAHELKREISAAKQELEKEEQLQAAKERMEHVDAGVASLMRKFEQVAADKVWFTGTGNDDAILPHQWQGMMFGAVAERWILGDGVGLGKTRTTIGWLDLVGAKKVIIVCEANICAQFAGEVVELAPHRTMVNLNGVKGRQRRGVKKTAVEVRHEKLDEILALDEATVVVNFEMWRRDKDALAKLIMWQADTVVVDEAHNLKSTSTSNFTSIKTLIAIDNECPKCRGHLKGLYDPALLPRKVPRPCAECGWKIGDPTPKRTLNKLEESLMTKSVKNVCLTTGTPILNSPLDLYSLVHLLNPILFKNKKAFQNFYLTNNYHSGKWEFSRGALDDLKPLIEGLFLARTAEDAGVVLPTQTHTVVPVPLDRIEYPKQWKAIRQISDAAQLVLDSGEAMTIMHLIALITRKRQANVWPGGIVIKNDAGEVIFDAGTEIDESVKMDAIIDNILDRHSGGARQLVFSQFKTALTELEDRLLAQGIRAVRFDGDTPTALRQEIKLNFDRANKQEAKWDVVLANYKTGGTGLNFTEATVTHIMDEEWNPGKRNQAYGRSHRIGQIEESEVLVYRIPGSIDTWMSNTIKRKEDMIDGFNDTMIGESTLKMDLLEALTSGEIL